MLLAPAPLASRRRCSRHAVRRANPPKGERQGAAQLHLLWGTEPALFRRPTDFPNARAKEDDMYTSLDHYIDGE